MTLNDKQQQPWHQQKETRRPLLLLLQDKLQTLNEDQLIFVMLLQLLLLKEQLKELQEEQIQKSRQRCEVWLSLHKIKENADHTCHHWHVFSKACPAEQNDEGVRYRSHVNDVRYGRPCTN